MNARELLRKLPPLLGTLLFAVALVVLHHLLRHWKLHEVLREVRALPKAQLGLAALLTLASYALLTGYDALALRYVGRALEYPRVALVSFIGYAFSHSIGFSLVTGASVRFRLYSSFGLSALEISQIVAFTGVTFWMGFALMAGTAFVVEPLAIPASFHFPFGSARPLGAALLLLLAVAIALAVARRRPITVRGLELRLPSRPVLLSQLVLGAADWAIAAAVVYALLPAAARTGYPTFLSMFLLAQVAGLVSHVPGGLGVFETVIVLLLPADVPAPGVLSALIAYRAIYYLLPFGAAALLLGATEAAERRERLAAVAKRAGAILPGLVPVVLPYVVFVAGALLVLSGSLPPARGNVAWLNRVFPLPLIELSHFLASFVGIGLLVLARGLQRRLDAAYHLTVILLAAGIVLSLLKGFAIVEALVLAIFLAMLFGARGFFYRRATLTSERFTAPWLSAIALVVVSSVWLAVFSVKHVQYSNELLWRFELSGDAPRILRATAGVSAAVIAIAGTRLLRPAPKEPALPSSADLDRAAAVVACSKDTLSALALLGDKEILFSDDGRAFLMYGIEGRSWIALGDPTGSEAQAEELVWRFREIADRHDGWTVFHHVHPRALPLYLDLGLTILKIGEEARVPLEGFSLDGKSRKGLRQVVNRSEREGLGFAIVPAAEVPALLPELRAISDAWLGGKKTREKRFSIGFFDERYLARSPAAVVRREGRAIAFANVLAGAEKEELSVDLMRYLPDEARGAMDYLFAELMRYGAHEGFRFFNLGMAPLSGLESHPLAPVWNRLGATIFHLGEHFYNFQGLRDYKDKFDPVWEPRYLASPAGLALPRILANLGTLISGGTRGIVGK